MFTDMGYSDTARLDAMDAAFEPWVAERMARGEYLGWLAVGPAGEVVAGAGLWIMDWPPHTLGVDPRRGNILNVYVAPAHRRRGLARRLVVATLDWCRAHGVEGVILHASDAGRPLYTALGFQPTNEMRLLLSQG
jgi:GNAT superfamily N-acetyltransferase